MKPILFNTEMVRAILDGRKSVTRRVVKPQPLWIKTPVQQEGYPGYWGNWDDEKIYKSPYLPGEILYVRETWNYGYCDNTDFEGRINEPFFEELPLSSRMGTYLMPRYFYRTEDLDGIVGMKWHPSIHMPKEAARIFLRVTDVQVERLQNITNEGARAEGCDGRCESPQDGMLSDWQMIYDFSIEKFQSVWDDCYAKPRPIKDECGVITHYESYPWEDIRETRTYKGKPWIVIGNPWVWNIAFERISKEVALDAGA